MKNSRHLLINYGYFISQPINDYHTARSNGSEVPLVNDFLTFSRHHDVDNSNELSIRNAAYQCDEFINKLQLDHSCLTFKKIRFNEYQEVVYEFELQLPNQEIVIGIDYCNGFCTDYPVGTHNKSLQDLSEMELTQLEKQLCLSIDKRRNSKKFKLYI